MSLDSASHPPPTSPRSKNRSLFSKFTAPFNNRNRNISEFYVQPDDPWRTYSPGDVVKGSVVLTVAKPLRITHLVVCLHGYVKVFKNPVSSGGGAEDSGFLGTGRGRRGGEYLGNGFASLFEDEVVLCGDGRLKEGVYRFNFELDFPQDNLPTSINFERGTISYMITSTLTRPTTISPTMTCDKRIALLENIDIAPLPAPKPRVISLEPVPKKPKTKPRVKSVSGEQLHGVTSQDSSMNGVASNDRPAPSPVPSDISGSSCVSNSSQSFRITTDLNSTNNNPSARNSESRSTSTGSSDKTITATTELLRAGALPGDTIPLKISINHTKPLRSPHAIIVTLYRQGRIDTHPAIPVGTPEKGKKPIYEDYYPKSKTGLGGLNFGATKSSTAFRKDLSQTFAPLFVDPTTMTAVVSTSVRIPEDSFPSITRVPGAMINFRYYVEVVIDLRGKLAGQDRFLPRLNMMSLTSNYGPSGQVVNAMDKGRTPITSTWAGNILNTDQIRREKGVVACIFEVTVGSKDTARGQRLSSDETSPEGPPTPSHDTQPFREDWQYEEQIYQQHYGFQDQEHIPPEQYEYYHQDHTWPPYPGQNLPVSPSQFIPPTQPEENVDEKTRLRMAEETLLPSRPPGDDDHAGPSDPMAPLPSAPPDPEMANGAPPYEYYSRPVDGEPGARHQLTSALSLDTIVQGPGPAQPGPSSPSTLRYDDQNSPQDDKRELERQRLLEQASAPPGQEPEGDCHTNGQDVTPSPTAPTFSEEDQYDLSGSPMGHSEPLPQYQR